MGFGFLLDLSSCLRRDEQGPVLIQPGNNDPTQRVIDGSYGQPRYTLTYICRMTIKDRL